jgi:hypothetical protein
LFDFPQIGVNKQEECESLSQHDRAPPPFFGHEVQNASTSDILIGALQEADLCRVPEKNSRPLTNRYFYELFINGMFFVQRLSEIFVVRKL